MKIKKGDNVIVTTGASRGKKGTVKTVLVEESRVIVEGLNKRKVHIKAKRSGDKGKVIEREMPIHISNVMIVDPKSGKPSRIGYKVEKDKKVRIAKKSGATI